MSAGVESPFSNYDNSILDRILIDPTVRKLVKEVDELTHLQSGLSLADAQNLKVKCDRAWGAMGLMHEPTRVTGVGHFVMPETEDSPMYSEPHHLDRQESQSHGFTIMRLQEGQKSFSFEEHAFELALHFSEIIRHADGTIGTCQFAVYLGDLQGLEFSQTMSYEQAEAILDFYVPEQKRAIDQSLTCSDDEIEILHDLSTTPSNIFDAKEDADRIGRALSAYVNAHVRFDALPYELSSTTGHGYEATENSHEALEIFIDDRSYAQIHRIMYMEKSNEAGTGVLHPHLQCTLFEQSKFGEAKFLYVPVDMLRHITSIRT